MAKLIPSEGVGKAWLAAARHLNEQKDRKDRNLVLEISSPQVLSVDDRKILKEVDVVLRQHNPDLSIETVSGTIFPNGLYRRDQRPQFYKTYADLMAQAKKRSSWGTY